MAVKTVAVPKGKPALPAGGKRHPVLWVEYLNTFVFTKKNTEFTRVNKQSQDLTDAQHARLSVRDPGGVAGALPHLCATWSQTPIRTRAAERRVFRGC